MREVIEGARDQMRVWDDAVSHGGTLSDEEMVRRYVQQHRGQPDALLGFASRRASGGDVLQAAVDYEQDMEQRLRAAGGG